MAIQETIVVDQLPRAAGASLAILITTLFVIAECILPTTPAFAQLVEPQEPPAIVALPVRRLAARPRSLAVAQNPMPFSVTQNPTVFKSTAPAGFALFDSLFSDQSRRSTSPRLAGVPNMFGDFSFSGIHMSQGSFPFSTGDAPLAGGSRGFKLAENGKALPQDRVYYMYHHFHNAVEVNAVGPFTTLTSLSVDRHTVGFERTFQEGWSSIDVRMNVTGGADFAAPGSIVRVETGDVGDLALSFKRLLYDDGDTAYSTGVGVTVPTGSDLDVIAPLDGAGFRLHNDSVHVLPFLAAMYHPNDQYFYQAITQIDAPLNGNRVEGRSLAGDALGPVLETGILTDQPILFVDLSAGVWLWQNPNAIWNRGLAAVLEYHYTSTMGNADFVSLPLVSGFPAVSSNSFDISNFTVGLHLQLTHGTNVRVAGVFPLENSGSPDVFTDDDRLFDSEFQLQINRQF